MLKLMGDLEYQNLQLSKLINDMRRGRNTTPHGIFMSAFTIVAGLAKALILFGERVNSSTPTAQYPRVQSGSVPAPINDAPTQPLPIVDARFDKKS